MLFFILCYRVGRAFNCECAFFIDAVLVLMVKTPSLNMNMSMSIVDIVNDIIIIIKSGQF